MFPFGRVVEHEQRMMGSTFLGSFDLELKKYLERPGEQVLFARYMPAVLS